MAKINNNRNIEKEIEEAFQAFDRRGNGFLSRTEMQDIFQNIGEPLTEEEIEALLNEADEDRDGFVYYEEFCNLADLPI